MTKARHRLALLLPVLAVSLPGTAFASDFRSVAGNLLSAALGFAVLGLSVLSFGRWPVLKLLACMVALIGAASWMKDAYFHPVSLLLAGGVVVLLFDMIIGLRRS